MGNNNKDVHSKSTKCEFSTFPQYANKIVINFKGRHTAINYRHLTDTALLVHAYSGEISLYEVI